MNPDLVGASGVQVAENEACAIVCLVEHLVVGDGCFSTAGIDHRHFHSVYRMASDVGENAIGFFMGWRLYDGEVAFFGGSVCELAGE